MKINFKIKYLFFIFLFANTSFSHAQDTQNIKTVGTFSLYNRKIEIQKDGQDIRINHKTTHADYCWRPLFFITISLVPFAFISSMPLQKIEAAKLGYCVSFIMISAFLGLQEMYDNYKTTGNLLLHERQRGILFSTNDHYTLEDLPRSTVFLTNQSNQNDLCVNHVKFKFGNTEESRRIRSTAELLYKFSQKENQEEDNHEFYETFTKMDKEFKKLFDDH